MSAMRDGGEMVKVIFGLNWSHCYDYMMEDDNEED